MALVVFALGFMMIVNTVALGPRVEPKPKVDVPPSLVQVRSSTSQALSRVLVWPQPFRPHDCAPWFSCSYHVDCCHCGADLFSVRVRLRLCLLHRLGSCCTSCFQQLLTLRSEVSTHLRKCVLQKNLPRSALMSKW